MAETVSNVSTAKPKVGGAVYIGPLTATMPTDATTALASGFVSLGYCSEDGLTNNNSPSTDTSKAWGGDTVYTMMTEKPDEFSFTLIEALNLDVLKLIYGSTNVSGTLDAGITVSATASEAEAKAYVFEMVMREGVVKRIVVPNGVVKEVGEIAYKDDGLVGYNVTISAMPDANGVTHKEYIKKASGT